MRLVQLTNPTELPVDLCEVKDHLGIVGTDDDIRLIRLIKAATNRIERFSGMRLCSQTVRLDLEGFPSDELDLRVYPVQSIDTFVYDATDGTETAMVLSTDYYQALNGMYPIVGPLTVWPSTLYKGLASVRISMTVGYASVDNIPEDIRHAVIMLTKELFDVGGESVTTTMMPAMNTVESLMALHRRIHI